MGFYMTTDSDKKFNLEAIRDKFKGTQNEQPDSSLPSAMSNFSWQAVSHVGDNNGGRSNFLNSIDFVGKNLENGKFAHENLENANFSVANLSGVDFSGADLRGVDFSGANLTDANLSGADLSGAILSGTVLARTNFTGAKMHGVKLTEAYLEDAIMLGAELDDLSIEELQLLVEYMAKYYPHKLNLSKLNLTLLDLKKIDLTKVSLRGVDFTGVDFTGINILELDLSECIITPQQIAQALGHVPNKEELAKLLAPKKKKAQTFNRFDVSEIFLDDGREWGVWDVTHDKGISIESLMKVGKKIFRHGAGRPPVKDEEVLKNIKSEQELRAKSHNDELRKVIEERKKKELENRVAMKKELQQEIERGNRPEKAPEQKTPVREIKENIIAIRDQGRGRE